MDKALFYLKWILNAFILAGAVILCIGLYYLVVKAGIPYQDPPLDLQIKYAVNMEIGEVLARDGFCISILGTVLRIVIGVVGKRHLGQNGKND